MLPEVCTKCHKLIDPSLGAYIVKNRKKWFICNSCREKKTKSQRALAGKTRRESPAERSLRTFLTDEGYKPVCEFPIEQFQYDFAFPKLRLLMELDSKRWHSSQRAIIRDKRKAKVAKDNEWMLVRISVGRWMKNDALAAIKQRQACFNSAS